MLLFMRSSSGMRRAGEFRRIAGFWAAAGCAASLGCSSEGTAPNDPAPGQRGHSICPQCRAGGETSDFGSTVEPSPCEKSEEPVAVDEEAARALGFGTVLDHVERSVDRPFEWTAVEAQAGAPAEGYTSATRVSFASSIVSAEHLVPSLEGCEDRLAVHLLVSFQSEDGALSIQGPMLVKASRDERAPQGSAFLDLATAEGSLRLHPDSSSLVVVGRVVLAARFWPEDVRGFVRPYVVDDASIEQDTANFYYEPLNGRWPVDACPTHAWPLDADAPGATPDGDSALTMRDQLQSLLNQDPAAGTWWDGTESVVTTELGPPTQICVEEAHSRVLQLGYSVPITLSTDDGRLQVAQSGVGRHLVR